MNGKDKLKKVLQNASNGVITTQQITKAGLHRGLLLKLVDDGKVYRFSRGLYVDSSSWEDEIYLLQCKYKKGIFSHNTALYQLGFSDRTPALYDMTFPKGYNSQSLKNENVSITRVVKKFYSLGDIQASSPCGNAVHVYDIERTLCDMLRNRMSDIQVVIHAIKQYAQSKEKDIQKLIQYAEKLHVKSKIARYLEVLL